ncbi:hypothetical protein FOA52_012420 [Chlamydomonas sp. UWO 241]|nr:hypothetical protein FOA52_012420 [Chlamydomonas sp. UWO 241]
MSCPFRGMGGFGRSASTPVESAPAGEGGVATSTAAPRCPFRGVLDLVGGSARPAADTPSADALAPAPAPAPAAPNQRTTTDGSSNSSAAGRCPLGFTSSGGPGAGGGSGGDNDAAPASDFKQGVCPLGFTSLGGPATSSSGDAGGSDTTDLSTGLEPGVCPLGFGSAAGGAPRLSKLHCTLCRSYLHACTSVVPCGHRFCSFCITPFRDCPTCGADVERLAEETDVQRLAEEVVISCWLQTAVGSPTCGADVERLAEQTEVQTAVEALLALMANTGDGAAAAGAGSAAAGAAGAGAATAAVAPAEAAGAAPVPGTMPAPGAAARVAFFLRLGTEALAGGNLHAAFDRFQLCADELRGMLEVPGGEGGGEGAVRVACQLGAVLGLQADCCRRAGDAGGAARLYRESIGALAPHARVELGGRSDNVAEAESAHALSVSHNKLGDVMYGVEDAAGAAEAYRASLTVRRRLLAAAPGGADLAARAEAGAKLPQSSAGDTGAGSAAAECSPACVGAALDVAASLIKVGDAEQAAAADAAAANAGAEGTAPAAAAAATAAGAAAGSSASEGAASASGARAARGGGGAAASAPGSTSAPGHACLSEAAALLALLRPTAQPHGDADKVSVAPGYATRWFSLHAALERCKGAL